MFKNLKIGTRLGLGFMTLLGLLGVLLGVAVWQMAAIEAKLQQITGIDEKQTQLISGVRDAVNLRAIAARNITLLADPAAQAGELALAKKAKAAIDARLAELGTTLDAEGAEAASLKTMYAKARELEAKYEPIAQSIVALALAQKQSQAAPKLAAECMPLLTQVTANLDEFADAKHAQSQRRVAEADAAYKQALLILLAIGAAALAAGCVLAWTLTRSITRPLGQALAVAQTVARGDLTSRIETDQRDECGQLLRALKAMNESLVGVVGTVRRSSDSIATGSAEIVVGSQDLSQRTETQAANLQQTAASMEELSSTVRNSAETAREAAQLATAASEVAARGGVAVGQVVETMGAISTASRKIADIIGVIDGIAFQTNILALNAAVEAARAGEQGRGFAVVASEVRSLAQRSAQAAKEIKGLIVDSVQKVECGSAQVSDAGRTMGDIVSQVRRVTDLIGEISAATQQQTAGIGQVGDAVVQLDDVTQQNAALVEQSAAAAESLKQQAGRLVEAVGVFKLAA